jgi:hypothetical protein
MSEKDQDELLRLTLLIVVQLQEELFALKLVLAGTGKLDPAILEAATNQAKQTLRPFRDAIERLEKEGGPSLADILRTFEGPIQ